MTVKELIIQLQQFSEEKIVRVEGLVIADGTTYYGYVTDTVDESAAVTICCEDEQ